MMKSAIVTLGRRIESNDSSVSEACGTLIGATLQTVERCSRGFGSKITGVVKVRNVTLTH